MTRIFVPPENISSDTVTITGDQARHLALVLRAKPGDLITVLDGKGHKYECRIVSVHKKEVVAEIMEKAPYSTESPVKITLVQSIAKGEKMDLIVQKSTELGASRIIPVITERSQVKKTGKTERWRKIALSASQQSGRDKIPEIVEPLELRDFLDSILPLTRGDSEGSLNIILSEAYKERNLKQILSGAQGITDITLLIGPEGGFSKEEVRAAIEKGFVEVSLGPRILRTETAPVAAISIIQYELGDMG